MEEPLPGVAVPGNADAKPDAGSIVVTLSPPKFRAMTESGNGVNLQITSISHGTI